MPHPDSGSWSGTLRQYRLHHLRRWLRGDESFLGHLRLALSAALVAGVGLLQTVRYMSGRSHSDHLEWQE